MASQQDRNKYKHKELTDEVIGIFYEVYNSLGYGFLESIYQKAFAHKLEKNRLSAEKEHPIPVYFEDITLGEFYADMVVNDLIILELKAVEKLVDQHESQLLNYLNATTFEVGLLFNFGPEPEVVRKAFDNENKDYNADGHIS